MLAFLAYQFHPAARAYQDIHETHSLLSMSLEELVHVKITTASRSEEAVIDAPAKVKIITKQQIHERGYINLFDLLRDQVGIDSQAYSHETTYNHVAIRGVVGNNRFLIQQDGVRIDSPAGDPIAVADNFPLFNAERVEIVYGPASALYGADAFTGVINIVTESENMDQSELGAYIGENDYRYFYGKTQLQLFDNVRLSLSGHFHEADNSDLSHHYPDVFALGDLVSFDGSVAIPAAQRGGYNAGTDSHSISTRLQLGEDFTIGFHQSLFESPTTTGLEPNAVDYGANASWSSRVGTICGIYEVDINDETSARLQASHHYYEVDQASKFNNLFSNFQNGFKYAESDKTQLEGQLSFVWDENNKIIIGGNVEKISALPKTADLPTPYDPDQPSAEQNLFYGGTNNSLPIRFFSTDYTNFGAFVHYRNSWFERLDGFFGIRYDNNSRYGETINPRAGLVYKPRSDLTLKLLYGEAFLSPAPDSLLSISVLSLVQLMRKAYIPAISFSFRTRISNRKSLEVSRLIFLTFIAPI